MESSRLRSPDREEMEWGGEKGDSPNSDFVSATVAPEREG